MDKKLHDIAVKDIRKETADCVSIAFDIPQYLHETFKFKQGQYLTLEAEINGEEVRRSYSICSSPFDNEWRVAVKKLPGGKFSTYANEALKIGDTLQIMPPMGRFYTDVDDSQSKNYLLFAAGSGITPILSILKTILIEEKQSNVILIYGNKSFDSIIFKEAIDDLKDKFMQRLQVHHVLSREKTAAEIFNGRIDADKIDILSRVFFDLEQIDEVFICGPEPMILSTKDYLLSKGMKREKVHVELFATTTVKQQTSVDEESQKLGGNKSKVSILLDGNRYDFEMDENIGNILDASMAAGADVPYACKGGVCCTCRAKVIKGNVSMDVNYALEPEEVENGFILTCQSHPKSDEVVVDFDVL